MSTRARIRRLKAWRGTFLTLPLLLLTAGAAAQEPEARFEGEVTVREVLLDVLVTDGEGNVVLGLEAEDFRVEEEGRPVAVESVTFYSNRRFLGDLGLSGAAGEAAATEERYFVLLFHRPLPGSIAGSASRILRMPEAGDGSFRWLVEELLPTDHLAVLSYDSSLALHHDFSRDRQRLSDAIERAAKGRRPRERWPSRLETPAEGISLAALGDRRRLARDTADLYGAIEILASALGEVRGRKNLILFGADFPPPTFTGRGDPYRRMVEALNAANVAVYGIEVGNHGRQATVDRLAADTGGAYTFRPTDFREPLNDIARETSGYYLLSYKSEQPADDDTFRRVKVETVNPEFTVRARSGYRAGGG